MDIFPVDTPAADALQILLCLFQGYTTQSTLFFSLQMQRIFHFICTFLKSLYHEGRGEIWGFEEMFFNHHCHIIQFKLI